MADIKKAAAAAKPVAKAVAATKPAEAKVEEKKVEAKKAVEEKKAAPAKKAAAPKKETAKKAAPAKKEAAVKAVTKVSVNLQFAGKEYTEKEILQKVKEIWTKNLKRKVGEMKDVKIYLKPEESAAYYVVNGDTTGKIDL